MGLLFQTSCVVKDLDRAAAFYDELLATIEGRRVVDQAPLAVGYGREGEDASFWLQSAEHFPFLKIASHCHFAFRVNTMGELMSFHDMALELGARRVFDSREQDDIAGFVGCVFEDLDGRCCQSNANSSPLGRSAPAHSAI